MKRITFCITFYMTILGVSSACEMNSDCETGAKCIKHHSEPYGVCMGGAYGGGNERDAEPNLESIQGLDTLGESCRYNSECGYQRSCAFDASGYGTCF